MPLLLASKLNPLRWASVWARLCGGGFLLPFEHVDFNRSLNQGRRRIACSDFL